MLLRCYTVDQQGHLQSTHQNNIPLCSTSELYCWSGEKTRAPGKVGFEILGKAMAGRDGAQSVWTGIV